MHTLANWRSASVLSLAAVLAFVPPALAQSEDDVGDAVGAVFVASNATTPGRGNEIRMFNRFEDGSLAYLGSFGTGGEGSGPGTLFAGDGIASQGSIVTSEDGRFLLVTNFRSNDVSVFEISRTGLVLTDVEPSGGQLPVAVAESDGVVYVLNSGGSGLSGGFFNANVVGFRLNDDGDLRPIRRSTRNLRSFTPDQGNGVPNVLFSASELQFSPNGRLLAVIIKEGGANPGRIDTFRVRRNGRLGPSTTNDSEGLVPFAMNFSDDGSRLYVVEAIGDNPRASVSSYRVRRNGRLVPISSVVPLSVNPPDDIALDSCWIVRSGSFLYAANFLSNTISVIEILDDGTLVLRGDFQTATSPPPVITQQAPSTFDYNLDLGLSPDGRYLYNVLPGPGTVAGFEVESDGSLTSIGEFEGLDQSPFVVDPAAQPLDQFPPFSTEGGSPAGIVAVDFDGFDDSLDD